MDFPYLYRVMTDLLQKYSADDSVSSVILVRGDELEYFRRGDEGVFVPDCRGCVYVGKNGYGKNREGDLKTPVGEFRAVTAFGVRPDPGTELPYIAVTGSTVACDSEGPWYNRIVDVSKLSEGSMCKGERMIDLVPEYNYGIALDYNPDNVYPLGSAIFFHCKGAKTWTGGCVAVDEEMMKHILLTCGQHPLVCIRPAEEESPL